MPAVRAATSACTSPCPISDRLLSRAIGELRPWYCRTGSLDRGAQLLEPDPKPQRRFTIVEVITFDSSAHIGCYGIDSTSFERSLNDAQVDVRVRKSDRTTEAIEMLEVFD